MFALFRLFNFAGHLTQIAFLKRAVGFAVFFAALWAIQVSGILAPDYARDNELLIFGLILACVPMLALMTRRLADTPFPGSLILAGPILLGLASASQTMFGWPLGQTILTYAAYAAFAALLAGLLWPSRSHSSQPA